MIETLKFLYDLDMDDKKEVDMNNPIAKPRVPYEILFVIGGWSGGSPTNMVETYDTRADRWVVCETPDSGVMVGAVFLVVDRANPYCVRCPSWYNFRAGS